VTLSNFVIHWPTCKHHSHIKYPPSHTSQWGLNFNMWSLKGPSNHIQTIWKHIPPFPPKSVFLKSIFFWAGQGGTCPQFLHPEAEVGGL
jgi:hypothetical protein